MVSHRPSTLFDPLCQFINAGVSVCRLKVLNQQRRNMHAVLRTGDTAAPFWPKHGDPGVTVNSTPKEMHCGVHFLDRQTLEVQTPTLRIPCV